MSHAALDAGPAFWPALSLHLFLSMCVWLPIKIFGAPSRTRSALAVARPAVTDSSRGGR